MLFKEPESASAPFTWLTLGFIQSIFTTIMLLHKETCWHNKIHLSVCRDGGYETSPLIGKFCGDQKPPALVSHSNRLWVRFHSDATTSSSGFTAHWDGTQTGQFLTCMHSY